MHTEQPTPVPSVRLLSAVLALSMAACAHRAPRPPGPLAPLGRDARLRPDPPAPTVEQPPPARKLPPRRQRGLGDEVAKAASYYLKNETTGFRNDCSGFVCASLDRAGLQLTGSTRSMWDRAKAEGATHRRKLPEPGDLAFFDNTYDRNKNGRFDDPLSHIAVVVDVEPDGTIYMAHDGTGRGRSTLTMNLNQPDLRATEDGKVLNDWLRRKRPGDPPSARYLAGELWRGFASPDDMGLR